MFYYGITTSRGISVAGSRQKTAQGTDNRQNTADQQKTGRNPENLQNDGGRQKTGWNSKNQQNDRDMQKTGTDTGGWQDASEEAFKKLRTLTKEKLLKTARFCFSVYQSYIGLRYRYDCLKASSQVSGRGNVYTGFFKEWQRQIK